MANFEPATSPDDIHRVGGGGVNHPLKLWCCFHVATIYLVCVKEYCRFVSSVSGACSSARASRIERGPLVEIYRPLSLSSLNSEE